MNKKRSNGELQGDEKEEEKKDMPPNKRQNNRYNLRSYQSKNQNQNPSTINSLDLEMNKDKILQLSDCKEIEHLGEGRLGTVLGCNFYGEKLAIKLIDVAKSKNVASLEKEILMYRRLKDLQGVCIPQIFRYRCEVIIVNNRISF
jgi:hypothetical protein